MPKSMQQKQHAAAILAQPSRLINIANMGFFSSDRSIADYCRDIWYIRPLTLKELPKHQ